MTETRPMKTKLAAIEARAKGMGPGPEFLQTKQALQEDIPWLVTELRAALTKLKVAEEALDSVKSEQCSVRVAAAINEALAAIRSETTPLRKVSGGSGNKTEPALQLPQVTLQTDCIYCDGTGRAAGRLGDSMYDCEYCGGGGSLKPVSPPKPELRHQCKRLERWGITLTSGAQCPECGEHFPPRQVLK